jgi:hypothetical protein
MPRLPHIAPLRACRVLGPTAMAQPKTYLMRSYTHWIRQLGRVLVYSTALGEATHARLKAMASFTNKAFRMVRPPRECNSGRGRALRHARRVDAPPRRACVRQLEQMCMRAQFVRIIQSAEELRSAGVSDPKGMLKKCEAERVPQYTGVCARPCAHARLRGTHGPAPCLRFMCPAPCRRAARSSGSTGQDLKFRFKAVRNIVGRVALTVRASPRPAHAAPHTPTTPPLNTGARLAAQRRATGC